MTGNSVGGGFTKAKAEEYIKSRPDGDYSIKKESSSFPKRESPILLRARLSRQNLSFTSVVISPSSLVLKALMVMWGDYATR